MKKRFMLVSILAALLVFSGCSDRKGEEKKPELPVDSSVSQETDLAPDAKEDSITVQQDGQQVTLAMHFADSPSAEAAFQLPEGLSLTRADQESSDREGSGQEEADLFVRKADGTVVGRMFVMDLAAGEEDLQTVVPSENKLPMQVFAGIALSNHVMYDNYTVQNSGKTSAAATAVYSWQDLSLLGEDYDAAAEVPFTEENSVLFYDYAKLPVFLQMNFAQEAVSQEQCAEIAKSIQLQ